MLTLVLMIMLTLAIVPPTLEQNGFVESPKYSGVKELKDERRDSQSSWVPSSSFWGDYDDKVSVTYYFSEPRIEEAPLFNGRSNSYVSVTIEGLPQYDVAGLPVLPFKTAKILLPFGIQFEYVRAISGKKMSLLGSYLVEYGQESLPLSGVKSPDASGTNFPNETVYGSSEPFPNRLYSDVSVQSKMGYKILLLNLYPVEYIPKTGELFYYESIRLEVKVTLDNGSETSAFNGYSQRREIVEGMVDNSEVIETYPTLEQTPAYQYVIITSEELNNTSGPNNFQALRDDKISRGISATIVTVEWIYANYIGTRPSGGEDNQTRIRNFIIDAYNNWGTMYVLLGGDGDGDDVGGESGDTIIPHRGFYARVTTTFPATIDYDIPADMYYSCLDGTFDYDGDGVYGEPNDGLVGGEVDLFAEVYVGRACVDSQEEVQDFVRKTLFYQTAVAAENADLGKVWMAGEYLEFGGVADWGGNFKDEVKEGSDAHGYTTVGLENSRYATGFNVSTLYDRDYPGNDWPKSEIIGVINDNVHLINHAGHANEGYVMKMTNTDVDTLLTNDELYFVGYSWGCYCGAFDDRTSTAGVYATYDCIIEHFTTEAHGAVAFIANSRYGWGKYYTTDGESQHYDREFWDALLGEDIFNLGVANQDSKEDSAGRVGIGAYRWCYYDINLLGDPELTIMLPPVYDHELDVGLEAPAYESVGASSLLTATVYNRGSNNESDVELYLKINGTTVENETIPKLAKGSSYTINYLWTPTIRGFYNITAYAPPVPDESSTDNNMKSTSVLVLPNILIVNDNDGSGHEDHGTSLPEFESALTDEGYDYFVWNESSMGNPPLDCLIKSKLVIWTCGDYWDWAVDSTDAATLEYYFAQGGNILLEGESIGYNHGSDDFMVDVAHATYQNYSAPVPGLTVTDPNHPVTFGLPANFTWLNGEPPTYTDGASPTNGGAEVIQFTGTTTTAVTVFEGANVGSVVYYAFPLYCLAQPEVQTLTNNSVRWLLVQRDILIVNDNDGNYHEELGTSLPEFESALTDEGYDYVVWNESSMGNPPLDFLTKFKLVIWTCGDYYDWAVDPTDAATLKYYFAQGGNILLEGESIGYDHRPADDFMVNVAHATYQDYGTSVLGLTVTDLNHPVTFGLPANFTWLNGEPPTYTDGASPTNGGVEVIQYTGTTTTAVTVFDGTGTENGSVVYYALPVYCLNQTERDRLVINSVNWLLPRTPGDVNGDGTVDASDLLDLSKAYGSEPGDSNWDPNCDFNDDAKVDASDLFDLSKNYGVTDSYAESQPANAYHVWSFLSVLSTAVMIVPKFRKDKKRSSRQLFL